MRRLPQHQQELLALNAWEGLDYGEIATVLGCSRNAVRIRLHRARTRLAAELASTGDTESEVHQTEPAVIVPAPQSPGRVPGTSFADAVARARYSEFSALPDQSQRG